ncbi:MAG: GIY-YIG nuclease family protein [Burkholderiaceae bacterium]
MQRLLDIGFETAGRWRLENDRLVLNLNAHADSAGVLYAFVSGGVVLYVGKTMRPLSVRLSSYCSPGPTQATNVANNRRILSALRAGESIDILVLLDNGLLRYGPFRISLAAGLEDDLIRAISPPWNGSTKPDSPFDVVVSKPSFSDAVPFECASSPEECAGRTLA